MKFSQVTIKDIARELGISPSTLSGALKDHPDISSKTKEAVRALAETKVLKTRLIVRDSPLRSIPARK